VAALFRGLYSLTRTKRRRFLWCAWWTGEPSADADSFRAPDAWSGGARTEEEAKAAAERAAGGPLRLIEGRWAGAWVRVRAGLPPFVVRPERAMTGAPPPVGGPHAVLGVRPGATMDEVKAAFRRKALEHHPDRGGEAAAFIAAKRAYDDLARRRPRRRR
jgi:hypothetical protein